MSMLLLLGISPKLILLKLFFKFNFFIEFFLIPEKGHTKASMDPVLG